jgi:hypothetical protein
MVSLNEAAAMSMVSTAVSGCDDLNTWIFPALPTVAGAANVMRSGASAQTPLAPGAGNRPVVTASIALPASTGPIALPSGMTIDPPPVDDDAAPSIDVAPPPEVDPSASVEGIAPSGAERALCAPQAARSPLNSASPYPHHEILISPPS